MNLYRCGVCCLALCSLAAPLCEHVGTPHTGKPVTVMWLACNPHGEEQPHGHDDATNTDRTEVVRTVVTTTGSPM